MSASPANRSRRVAELPHAGGAERNARARLRRRARQADAIYQTTCRYLRPYQIERPTPPSSGHSRAQAQDARRDGDRHRQDLHDGQRDLPADEVRRARRVLFLVDRRALAAQAVRAFASFEAEPGLKFDKIYEVYSQRFQQEDLDEDEKFDPKVMPN